MTQAQKIIKYLALALAFSIIFSIISGIMYTILSVTNILNDNDNVKGKLEELGINKNASVLDIEVRSSNIILKEGNALKVETNNENIDIKEKDNKLLITEKKHSWFDKNSDSDLVVYIPNNYIFDGVAIESKAGQIDANKIVTKNLDLDLGAGKVTIDNLIVKESSSIDGGAGRISILNGSINDLELDMGVGEISLTTKLTGNSEIDAGVGKVSLNLIGTDYKIKIEKGIGTATINKENIENNTYYGVGTNIVDIDGGVGAIDISTGN